MSGASQPIVIYVTVYEKTQYSKTCRNDHLNVATTSLHCLETTVPTDKALKEMVTGLAYTGHLYLRPETWGVARLSKYSTWYAFTS